MGGTTTTTHYVVDAELPYAQVVLETDGANQVIAKYTYADDLLKVSRNGEYYYFTDGLGSTRLLTDAAGAVVNRYTYDAYGTQLPTECEATVANEYLFTGERTDADTGLVYLRARYYDPTTGRFVQRDSYTGSTYDPASLHRYGYCHGNPVNGVDPSGHFFGLASMAYSSTLQSMRDGMRVHAMMKTMNFVSGIINAAQGGMYLVTAALEDNPWEQQKLTFMATGHFIIAVACFVSNHPVFWSGGSMMGGAAMAAVAQTTGVGISVITLANVLISERGAVASLVYIFEAARTNADSLAYFAKSKNELPDVNLDDHMLGQNGQKVQSETLTKWGKERVDVENQDPGVRLGNVHYHEPNNVKWPYDPVLKRFVYDKNFSEPAPSRIQKLLKEERVVNAIIRALRVYLKEI